MYFSGCLLLALTAPAIAENSPNTQAVQISKPTQGVDQMLYKGLIGNALDAVPMDSAQRVTLQRTNAVISNTLSGRSLTALAKLTNPALLIGSIAWGFWAASNINTPAAETPASGATDASASQPEHMAALQTAGQASDVPNARDNPPAANSASPAAPLQASPPLSEAPRPRVIKIWLAQP
ncbi:MAG: hypothetical protein ABL891_03355 [Burkholderiales bacterium]